jgi:hypothetical protein
MALRAGNAFRRGEMVFGEDSRLPAPDVGHFNVSVNDTPQSPNSMPRLDLRAFTPSLISRLR